MVLEADLKRLPGSDITAYEGPDSFLKAWKLEKRRQLWNQGEKELV
jgi:hypothetical protein